MSERTTQYNLFSMSRKGKKKKSLPHELQISSKHAETLPQFWILPSELSCKHLDSDYAFLVHFFPAWQSP